MPKISEKWGKVIGCWCVALVFIIAGVCMGLTIPSRADTEPVIGVLDKAEHFVISADGDLTALSATGKAIANGCTELHINIPDGVTSIKKNNSSYNGSPFYNNTKITSVTFPNGFTTLGNYAFYECTALTSIELPDGLTSVSNCAFYKCQSVTSITIPNSVTSIGSSAFANCSRITNITIPDSVTSIGENAFSSCTDLTSITILGAVTSMGNFAFQFCYNLNSITILGAVTTISNYAFQGSAVATIELPSSLTSFGVNVFNVCSRLRAIIAPDADTNERFKTMDNLKNYADKLTYPIGLQINLTDHNEVKSTYAEKILASNEKNDFANWHYVDGEWVEDPDYIVNTTLPELPSGYVWQDDAGNVLTTERVQQMIATAQGGDELVVINATAVKSEAPHEHEYTETARQEPTCATAGWVKYTCSCGDEYTETLPATGNHSYGAWQTTIPATTTAEGREERECSVCHDVESRTIPKLTTNPDPNPNPNPNPDPDPEQPVKPQIKAPTADTRTFTYNGTPQTYLPVGYNPTTMTIIDNTRTKVGTQTVTVALKDPDNKFVDTDTNAVTFTFEIKQAEIIIRRNGNEWFDERINGDENGELVGDLTVSFLNKDESGNYKYIITADGCPLSIAFKTQLYPHGADASADAYVTGVDKMPTIAKTTPKGRYEIYYQITDPAGNHAVKTGVWRIEIAGKEEYIIVLFNKPFTVTYGMDYLGQIRANIFKPDAGYITVDGMSLAEFASMVDVKVTEKHPNNYGGQNIGKYDIYFAYKATATETRTIIYRASNAGYDTNEDMLVIVPKELTIDWDKMEYTYADGAEYPISAQLTGFDAYPEADGLRIRFEIQTIDGKPLDRVTAAGSYIVKAYLVDDFGGNFVIAENYKTRGLVVNAPTSGWFGIPWLVWIIVFSVVMIFIILLLLLLFMKKEQRRGH